MSKLIDLTGQKFNRLTVLERAENSAEGRARWKCKCDCGNEIIVLGKHLRNGNTKSCGCLSRDKASERMKQRHLDNANSLIGKKYGKLTIIQPTEKRSPDGHIIYLCQCECGNLCEKTAHNLIQALNTQEYIPSCGCIYSSGQAIIQKLLTNNNIIYETEKTFNTCIFLDSQKKAKFDFYIPLKNYLIEYDGQQHFSFTNHGWNTEDKFIKTQEHDNIKNQWCKENNIPLIRIPYTHLPDLCIEDLLLETSKFII